MKFVSTRAQAAPVGFSEAIVHGLAPDGGLYVPTAFPRLDQARAARSAPLAEVAAEVLAPFVEGDPLEPHLAAICREAFDFPMPLVALERDTAVLELFHGPTAAFKDFGARFLAACLARLVGREASPAPACLTVLVATSGDTGAAVAAAFHRRPHVRVAVLFPEGGVSPRQQHQLTCWDDNVVSFAVSGTFDDCQRLVKEAFARPGWPPTGGLSSANSINVGRLLPQVMYYAVASSRYAEGYGREPGFIVPSGNVGNAIGAFWARALGAPIRHIALATNANRAVVDWFDGEPWRPRPSVPTLANAMDVGNPSNMERLFHLHPNGLDGLDHASALSVDDETIRKTIERGPERWGRTWCPHTATAVHFRERLSSPDWVVVATAHPSKFETIVEPLVGRPVPIPPALAALLARPARLVVVPAELEGVLKMIGGQA